MTEQELYEIVRKEIDIRASTDPVYRTIQKKIDDQKADFNDTARLSRLLSRILGEKLAKHILELPSDEGRSELCQQLLKDFFDELSQRFERVQSRLDRQNGVGLATVEPDFPAERVQNVAGSLNDTTVSDETIQRRCRNAVSNVANSMHDDFIWTNAEFRRKAGFFVEITRTTGAKACKWCQDVSGTFIGDYNNKALRQVFRRHDKCSCVITYYYKRYSASKNIVETTRVTLSGTTTTWEGQEQYEISELSKYQPTRYTLEQAEAIERKGLAKLGFIKEGEKIVYNKVKAEEYLEGLTTGENGGRISTGGKITDRNFMYYENFEKQARSFYDARVKGGDFDVKSIAENTGFDYEDVLAIKKHLMEEEHLFADGTIHKFDPSIDIALAWQRLMKGEQQEIDILLLNHELRELRYIQKTGCDYETAHKYSSQKYDWESAIPLFNETDSIDTSLL